MKNKEEPPERARGALPRKIACGDICGDPGGALYHMSCELNAGLTKQIAK